LQLTSFTCETTQITQQTPKPPQTHMKLYLPLRTTQTQLRHTIKTIDQQRSL